MSEQNDMNTPEDNAARLKSRNRALGLTLGGLVLFIFVVSYFKIDVATKSGTPVDQASEQVAE